ncbi:MAG: TetR/AcrR family transcriptional regulator, partial [Proteobacteria bacterium]|nr:TetR/AcrR family transcriptional regulator [Pseudomonadota bacterium]
AARSVFAAHGYHGTKTMQIAREAGVSEALVFQHFPSKLSVYRAVLRQVFREQDRNYEKVGIGITEPGTAGLVQSLWRYFHAIVADPHASGQEFYRLTLSSLAGDGQFAALVYRRAQRRANRQIAAAHAAARAAGDIVGEPLDIRNVNLFIEHVGTMMSALNILDPSSCPYSGTGDALVRQATWFCCRGIGLTDAAIALHLPAQS